MLRNRMSARILASAADDKVTLRSIPHVARVTRGCLANYGVVAAAAAPDSNFFFYTCPSIYNE